MSETRKTYVNRFIASGIAKETALAYSGSEIISKLKVELQYTSMATEKYGSADWMLRYVKNSATGNYEPVLYNKKGN